LPAEGPLVGIVGRLAAIKDHDTFLDMAARLAATRPDVTFVVAGDGALRAPLQAKAQELLGDRVRFLGWVTDLPTLYGALDVVVLSSRNEGTPVALIEAGAAAKPVVATDVGGVAEVVRDGETGFVVPPADAEALAGRVGRVLDEPETARGLGLAGRAWVRERFSAERLVEDLAFLYEDLMVLRRRGGDGKGRRGR
jgi:glycosyltransferase involved in cell wall biosynthesis